jgi:hypothetical protein
MDEPPSTPSGDSTIPRRTFLAACATGCTALAGCVGAGGDGCGFGFELTMTPATDDDYLRETLTAPSRDRPGDWREIVSTAVEADEARYTTVHAPPVRDGDRIEFEGRYYRLSREAVAGESVEAYVLAAEYDSGREPPSGATVVPFEDLPEADRAALREVFSDFEGRSDDVGGFSIGGYHVIYPGDTEADRSSSARSRPGSGTREPPSRSASRGPRRSSGSPTSSPPRSSPKTAKRISSTHGRRSSSTWATSRRTSARCSRAPSRPVRMASSSVSPRGPNGQLSTVWRGCRRRIPLATAPGSSGTTARCI